MKQQLSYSLSLSYLSTGPIGRVLSTLSTDDNWG